MSNATLNAPMKFSATWTATLPFNAVSTISSTGGPQKTVTFTTGTTTAGKANRVYGTILSLAAGANTTINLQSVTDVLDQTVNMTRVKGVAVQLLNSTDDTNVGSNATSVVMGLPVAVNPALSNSGNAGLFNTNGTMRVFNGGYFEWCNPSANGTAITNTNCNLTFTNEDASLAAAVYLVVIGADA